MYIPGIEMNSTGSLSEDSDTGLVSTLLIL
jgi:hypothetical protein